MYCLQNQKNPFSTVWKDIKTAFTVNSYCIIFQKDFEEVASYINAWQLRLVRLVNFNIIWHL
ncbi:ORF6C domain-containing protein [Bacillus paramycoides]|uniref:ORF6C domain-containing protein n=1 Tax=Bacillus paramycoides TaxID=2026194 RepID=UPI002E1BCECA|nr:ORF6C domain-containing protein [Bacillus paramycoides]